MPLLGLLGGAIPFRLILIVAGAIAAVGVWFTILGQAKQIGGLKKDLDAAMATADRNAAMAEAQRAEFERVQSILDTAEKEKAKIRDTVKIRRKVITDAPQSDDGPIAPILRRTLDGLRVGAKSDSGSRGITGTGNPGALVRPLPGTGAAGADGNATGRGDNR